MSQPAHLPNQQRLRRWWHTAFAAVIILTLIADLQPSRTDVGYRPSIELLALAMLVIAYLGLGVPALRTENRRLMIAYQAVMIAAVGLSATRASVVVNPLLVIGFTHCWVFAQGGRRRGLIATAALTVSMCFGLWLAKDWSLEFMSDNMFALALTFIFSSGMGLAFSNAERLSARNAKLSDELMAAQGQIAAAQHAAGVTVERERMGQEIHDTLAQGFLDIVMLTRTAIADLQAGADIEAHLAQLSLMEEIARDNLADARALVAALAPPPLQGATLSEALQTLVERWEAKTGIAVSVSISEPPMFSAAQRSTQATLLRVAQEAFTNIYRHAGANAASLVLHAESDGSMCLIVSDNGRGIAPDALESFGLSGMRNRVAAHGGTVTIHPAAEGVGTAVTVRLPLSDEKLGPDVTRRDLLAAGNATSLSPGSQVARRTLSHFEIDATDQVECLR
ncbi:MAG: sensor histidine kinase [Promicromonosporaceae bacterium]|nr:sensor histidine kinase [Promicromonosporaceae bacterium]